PAINVHPSLLPKYRGPSPMQSAILNGDAKTGISIMLLNQGMDSGPILAQQEIALSDQESTQTLEAKVCQLGPKLLLDTIDQFLNNKIKPIPQNEAEATVCTMLERSDAEITWNESLEEIDRKIRAFDPWPGTYFELAGNNRRLSAETLVKAGKSVIRIKIIKACLDKTGLNLLEVQPAGKKPMSIDQFINGYLS
ncbi:MAG: methionyl-tRNA formyltransferase, partial [Candidatus Uhrbacteria bacterium]